VKAGADVCPLCRVRLDDDVWLPDSWIEAVDVARGMRVRLHDGSGNVTSIWVGETSPVREPRSLRWFTVQGLLLARLVLMVTGDEESE